MAEPAAHRPAVRPHVVLADVHERESRLYALVSTSPDFDVSVGRLSAGDYLVAGAILVERKSIADFAVSVADGRLFPQVARLARQPLRPIVLVEGPVPAAMPNVHPHALKGAVLSIAVAWRVPVIFTRGPDDSLVALRMLAEQARAPAELVLPRGGRKPKRPTSLRLHVLQGFPGIGPALAQRLLGTFRSIEGVVLADEEELAAVKGVGAAKARWIRQIVGEGFPRNHPTGGPPQVTSSASPTTPSRHIVQRMSSQRAAMPGHAKQAS